MSKEISRQKKLNTLQEKHGELTRLKNAKKRELAKVMDEIAKINKDLKRVGSAIYDLKNLHGDTPHITDHAVVRYLERVKGMNIWDIKAEIINKNSVRIENTIVTVNGDEKDDPVEVKL
jgi:hypothetical protein